MINVMDKTASIKASPIGQDFQDALWGKQPGGALDVAQSIVTLKEHLVKDLSRGDKASPELKYLYPTYFDAARVLIAECAAEFFQAGCVRITALDPLRMRHCPASACAAPGEGACAWSVS